MEGAKITFCKFHGTVAVKPFFGDQYSKCYIVTSIMVKMTFDALLRKI